MRPADANEVAECWRVLMSQSKEPVALVLSRQNLPTFDRSVYLPASGVAQGAYILADAPDAKPDVLLIATGSEVYLCLDAYEALKKENIHARVISMPSTELFERQSQTYRDSVLLPHVKARVSVEQASTYGWERYVGENGHMIGMKTFGKSAPLLELQKQFGFTPDCIVEAARDQIKKARL
jgi:transketolase